ncbi:MAG: hypothetical protein K0R39_1070, partial [Symbiobacteriaceae bacterium]|nr:hypothetical protein [Symbiobacteriaceae bacterium]
MKRQMVGLVACAAWFLCALTAGAGAPRGRAEVLAETKRELATMAGVDRAALDKVMAGLGWVALPVVGQGELGPQGGTEAEGTADAGGARAPGALADATDLSTWLSAYRHEDWPMLTVFGSYHWRSCHFASLHGSYDLLGLDWADTDLTLIDLGTNDGQRVWYRGENPFQRSAVFNTKDPLKRSGLWPICDGGTLDGSAFVVFDVGNGEVGRILQFNS